MKKIKYSVIFLLVLLGVVVINSCSSSNSSLEKISGTYTFQMSESKEVAPGIVDGRTEECDFVLTKDGRMYVRYHDGSGCVIGKVEDMTANAFSVYCHFPFAMKFCIDGGSVGVDSYKTLVFDTEKKVMYFSMDDFNNRDISFPYNASYKYSSQIKTLKK
ncbi:hypothetical protein [Bacteroides thetaiotaomicron]|uniref:hypothetical protein n=1 Tax=Bacteroides thetaiotaomicron TaxID=818 RepID=UPI0023308904|nr:hypothetical protein [Bacteroides thetaiotaomicron]MDC2180815.1 hypothetical protein [Bacteroides thetaiotaomicron]